MEERTGEAFELNERLTVIGRKLRPGDAAPEFALDHFDPKTSTMQTVRLVDSAGTVRLLNVINRIVHTEYVADQMREPNYEEAVRAARQAAV